MEEFPASKVHFQPATWLTGSFPADVCPDITGQFGCAHTAKLRISVGGGGGGWDDDKKLGGDRSL